MKKLVWRFKPQTDISFFIIQVSNKLGNFSAQKATDCKIKKGKFFFSYLL